MAYARINNNTSQQQGRLIGVKFQRGFVFGAIMLAALFAFELNTVRIKEKAENKRAIW